MGARTHLQAGLPDVREIQSGAHVCALYSGPDERDRLLVPFVKEGLRHGDECVCLVDGLEPAKVRLQDHVPADPGEPRPSGHLAVHAPSDVRPRAGEFSVGQAAAILAATLRASIDAEAARLRAATDLPWLNAPMAEQLFVYESAVNEVLADLPVLFLCMYDLKRLDPSTVVDVLKMHSKVLLDGTVLDNPGCLQTAHCPPSTPDAVARYPLTRLRSGDPDGCDQWLDLTGAEVRVAELVARGLTNRATAAELMVSPHTVDAHLKHMYSKLGIHSRVELTRLALQYGAPAT